MKKRSKKYNPLRRAEMTARAFMRNRAVAWCGSQKAEVFLLPSLRKTAISQLEGVAIQEVAHKWTVYLCVLCRDHNGRDYLNTYPVNTVYTKVEFISDSVQEALANVLKQNNENHVVNLGWVATTHEAELTDQQIDTMLTELGAWEYLAKHEIKEDTVILGEAAA